MASQIEREKVFGNFKPGKTARVKAARAKKPAAERRPGMSADHLDCIRQLPCCACLTLRRSNGCRNEAHHLKAGTNERGAGMRSTDKWAVPLCRVHHEEIERAGAKNEPAMFTAWGIADQLQLASDLWKSTGDVSKMIRIVYAHKTIGN